MSLDEFWKATPGEVAVVMYADGERRLDRLELGVHQVWLGRVLSHMPKPDPARVLPKRRGRKARGARTIDEAFTRQETARWARVFAEQKAESAP